MDYLGIYFTSQFKNEKISFFPYHFYLDQHVRAEFYITTLPGRTNS